MIHGPMKNVLLRERNILQQMCLSNHRDYQISPVRTPAEHEWAVQKWIAHYEREAELHGPHAERA